MVFLHFDEAKLAAEAAIREWLGRQSQPTKVLLVVDLFGKLRLVVWAAQAPETSVLDDMLKERCGQWWTGDVEHVEEVDDITRELYKSALMQARCDLEERRLFVLDRHRSRTGWFIDLDQPLWPAPDPYPPIVVFYSFKGGLGRSTILTSFAIQRAQAGERVCVFDLDLDSPGVGLLLAADVEGLTARWGVVDFLLEQPPDEAPLSDYYHRCDRVAGTGEIVVFPAGHLDEAYPDKLARVDGEEPPRAGESGLVKLLTRARDDLNPKWILLDARTGISEWAGPLLSGIAHLHVLVGTTQRESWRGLKQVLYRLGKERVLAGRSQAEVLLVQALVPPGEAGKIAYNTFLGQAERAFTELYYAEAGTAEEDADDLWTIRDIETQDAPHVPVEVEYDPKLASFGDIAEVADILCGGPYARIAERITGRFLLEAEP